MPEDDISTTRFAVRLEQRLDEHFRALCESTGRSPTDLGRKLIEAVARAPDAATFNLLAQRTLEFIRQEIDRIAREQEAAVPGPGKRSRSA